MKKILFLLAGLLCSATASAEDTVIYSYTKTGQKPAEWAMIPIIASVSNTTPDTLFDTLKKKKLPTYGSTTFEPAKKLVQIDPTKCAYGSIISAEIGLTFEAHHIAQPRYTCDGRDIPSAAASLTRYTPTIPLWQALSATAIDEPALIQLGDEFISVREFRDRLKKQDKSLIKATENDFGDPSIFVKSGAMKGYILQKFPNAEKRIAKELGSSNTGNVSAAMAALSGSRDAAVIAQMKAVLQKKDANQEAYALSMLDSDNPTLLDDALVILLKSQSDANFNKALAMLDKTSKIELLRDNLDDILNASSPTHARELTRRMITAHGDDQIANYLAKSESSDTLQAIADTSLAQSQNAGLKHTSLSVRLQNPNSDTAFDALDLLIADADARQNPEYFKRGLKSGFTGIQLASFDQLEQQNLIEPESKKGAQYLESAANAPTDAIAQLTADAYHSDPAVRKDIARATRYLDTAGDPLRLILFKDSDESVARLAVSQTAKRPASEISLPMIKEMTSRAEQSVEVKIAVLHSIPRILNEKTTQTIVTYAGNEMFDSNILIKIAAIRALGEIAVRTGDPVIADNAVTSLALTSQDKSGIIVHHTLTALGKTKLPAAREIIERAKPEHPDSVRMAMQFFNSK